MRHIVTTLSAAIVLGFAASAAHAGAKCPAYPKADWMKADDAKARIEAQGYKISKFKVDGNCYEIYGHNTEGKKVENLFRCQNPGRGEIGNRKIRKKQGQSRRLATPAPTIRQHAASRA